MTTLSPVGRPALHLYRCIFFLALACAFAGCVAPGLTAFKMSPDAAAIRARETREFADHPPSEMLAACAGVLQDLDFTVVESEHRVGLLVARKERSGRREEGLAEVALLVPLTLVTSLLVPGPDDPPDRQVIQACVVVEPRGDEGSRVRLTLQRTVYAHSQRILTVESLPDPQLLATFFEALAKSAFLEAHPI